MISLRQIEKVYPLKGGPFYALRAISLTINQGEFVSIMGPSGSGKSTLLHILGLHDSAWSGQFDLLGQPVHQLDKKRRFELQKQHIGFVFQSYHLLDDLTVYENLEIPLSYRDVPKRERESIVCDVLDRFAIVEKRTSIPTSSRADNNSSSAWPAPSSPNRRSSSLMNPPAISIPTKAARS